jgi:ribonucleotide monophosphatase NagD (HAD superfamily)
VDLEGAKSLGMLTILVKTGKNSDNSGKSYPASYHAEDFSAACDWIQQHNASKSL